MPGDVISSPWHLLINVYCANDTVTVLLLVSRDTVYVPATHGFTQKQPSPVSHGTGVSRAVSTLSPDADDE